MPLSAAAHYHNTCIVAYPTFLNDERMTKTLEKIAD